MSFGKNNFHRFNVTFRFNLNSQVNLQILIDTTAMSSFVMFMAYYVPKRTAVCPPRRPWRCLTPAHPETAHCWSDRSSANSWYVSDIKREFNFTSGCSCDLIERHVLQLRGDGAKAHGCERVYHGWVRACWSPALERVRPHCCSKHKLRFNTAADKFCFVFATSCM